MLNILFVCLGNICRSPMAEGVFMNHVSKRGLKEKILADSAGTAAYHIGKNPDIRMCSTAKCYGIELNHQARQFCRDDFNTFDYILAMDNSNYEDILSLSSDENHSDKVIMMRKFDSETGQLNVPDPYYGGQEGFDNVYRILNRCTHNFLNYLIEKHDL